MARFRGTCKGNRGEASRLGHQGLRTEANGWNGGITVNGWRKLDEADADVFTAWVTDGSSAADMPKQFARLFTSNATGAQMLTLFDPGTGAILARFAKLDGEPWRPAD